MRVSTSVEKLLKFIDYQIKVEKEIVNSLNEALDEIDNPAVKAVLSGISLDSLKHADMYEAVLPKHLFIIVSHAGKSFKILQK